MPPKSQHRLLIIFLAECNNNFRPLSVIALQETHLIAGTDINSLQIPDYNLVYDLARKTRLVELHYMYTNLLVLNGYRQFNLTKHLLCMKAYYCKFITMIINIGSM